MRAGDGASFSFARLLWRYRLAAGLSQEALAERAGLTAKGIGAFRAAARGQEPPLGARGPAVARAGLPLPLTPLSG